MCGPLEREPSPQTKPDRASSSSHTDTSRFINQTNTPTLLGRRPQPCVRLLLQLPRHALLRRVGPCCRWWMRRVVSYAGASTCVQTNDIAIHNHRKHQTPPIHGPTVIRLLGRQIKPSARPACRRRRRRRPSNPCRRRPLLPPPLRDPCSSSSRGRVGGRGGRHAAWLSTWCGLLFWWFR